MGDANENRNKSRKEMLNLSLQIEKYPRDLLQRFRSTSDSQQSLELTRSGETAEEIELNLGLSLGGRFGVDKNVKKKLLRSSSIAGSIPIFREIDLATTPAADDTTTTQAATYPTLIRASSLPTETEEEWRKRKELQTLRRMEAKRRRSEKQRNSSSSASINSAKTEVNLADEKHNLAGNRTVAPPFGMQSWAAAARQALLGGGVKGGSGGGFLQGLVLPCSQGSVESQGGSSSGITEFESQPLQGTQRLIFLFVSIDFDYEQNWCFFFFFGFCGGGVLCWFGMILVAFVWYIRICSVSFLLDFIILLVKSFFHF